ncbi:response regulator [Caulobacter sp. CCNWLY153]|jgi:CheY-like chemotaxis protein|uniref:response regulator n=1 Tax=unclassified Caulobacter TaxID=2648921 RepID=UPI002FF1743A
MGSEGGETADGARAAPQVVLVVEDEVLVRMLACDILEDAGYDALEAVDAREALVLLDARPDIALMFTDVDMPGEINGLGLARLAALRWPKLPIIATSGAAVPKPVDLPANGRYLPKPYRPSALLDLVIAMMAPTPIVDA